MIPYHEKIGYSDAKEVWLYWEKNYSHYLERDFKLGKQGRVILNIDNQRVMLRLPPLFIGNTPEDISPQIGEYLVLLIEAGQGSCGYFKDNELLAHKVFRSYMVRKKQGKAQITYLKQKGKSRAGSRIRLSETELFIQEIIQWVNSHIEKRDVKRIILSVSPYLWSLFYKGKDRFIFDQRDSRIITPGIYWNQAGYLQMCHLARNLFYGELIDFTNQFGKGIETYCTLPN